MDIKYIGHASFFIKTKDARVVTDPFGAMVGFKFPKTEADIVTVSHAHEDHNNVTGVSGTPLIIDWPGEFEKQGVRVTGFKTSHDKKKGQERGENIVYKIEADDISILHCGDLGHTLDNDFVDAIGEVDILLLPVGGHYTIDAAEAAEVVKKIDPYIVIPMHYKTANHDEKVFGELSGLDEFIKKMGTTPETLSKLSIKKEDFVEDLKVVVLEQ